MNMRTYWWQAGVHIKPESDEERAFLGACTQSKNLALLARASEQFEVRFETLVSGISKVEMREGHNKESIIPVDDSVNSSLE